MRRPVITVLNFDLPAHDLSRRPQLPPDVLTIRHVLRMPEDPELARVLHNHLLDSDSIERRVLVPVSPGSAPMPSPGVCFWDDGDSEQQTF